MKTILILEDEPALMALFRAVLSGYTILEASTAEEALRVFLEHDRKLDLLIADVVLRVGSGISGIHVALLLREANSNLSILLTSGYPRSLWNDPDGADLKRLGSDSVAILQKPFSPATLLRHVYDSIGPPSGATGAGFGAKLLRFRYNRAAARTADFLRERLQNRPGA